MDSIGTIVACMRATAETLELPPLEDRAVRSTIGLGMHELVETLYPGRDDAFLERLVSCYRDHWFDGYRDRLLPFEGMVELFEELERRGHLLAVATGKGRPGLDHDLATTGLGRFFVASRTVSESAGKPSPAMLLEILDELGVEADDALMVGDTVHDLRMAANAGVDAVAVVSGAQGRELLEPLGPVAVLDDVRALPTWLDELDG